MTPSRRHLLRNLTAVFLDAVGLPVLRSGRALASSVRLNTGLDRSTAVVTRAHEDSQERAEESIRMEIVLNGVWETARNTVAEAVPSNGWSPERVPAMPLAVNPPVESAWYRYKIHIPSDWVSPGRRFFLRFEKVGHYAAVYLNHELIIEHFGQYTPFEGEVTHVLEAGRVNDIAIYVHNSCGKYARSGVVLTTPEEANAYRSATVREYERNWVGIVGNIYLCWRPADYIADVFVIPSVRKAHLEVRVTVAKELNDTSNLWVRTEVMDGEDVVLTLPQTPVSIEGTTTLHAPWASATHWGPHPYGTPKLYTLRVELLSGDKLQDRHFTRFGFREIWIDGRDVLLNGKKLWMAGTYFGKLAPIIYLNDRCPEEQMSAIMQSSGLNTLHAHWDSLGETWLDLCDEMGMLVLAAFFCDGRPDIQSKADSGWANWMSETCGAWVRTVRNHPCIVMWRPTDVLPENLASDRDSFYATFANQVKREDGTRPIADGSDVVAWAQSSLRDPPVVNDAFEAWIQGNNRSSTEDRVYDDGSRMALALASSTKPFITKEIYTGFADDAKLGQFFREFYRRSFEGGSTGIIVQYLPLIEQTEAFNIMWLSNGGLGNRGSGTQISERELPNWCDPTRPAWRPTFYSQLFTDLYQSFMNSNLRPYDCVIPGELLITGLEADEVVFIVPTNPALTMAKAVRADADGTAWIDSIQPVAYLLRSREHLTRFVGQKHTISKKPGYDYVKRLIAPKRAAMNEPG